MIRWTSNINWDIPSEEQCVRKDHKKMNMDNIGIADTWREYNSQLSNEY